MTLDLIQKEKRKGKGEAEKLRCGEQGERESKREKIEEKREEKREKGKIKEKGKEREREVTGGEKGRGHN